MNDKKFTDDESIKALEVHSDTENSCMGVCPYSGDRLCGSKMAKDALAIINRQKVEIERLNKEVDRLSQCVLYHDGIVSDLEKDVFNAKAEAIKDFAERLKANMSNIARMEYGGNIYFCVGYDLIDNLVKEMTEENK